MSTATLNTETQKQEIFLGGQAIWTEITPQEVAELAQDQSQKALGALTIFEFAPEQSQADQLQKEEYSRSLRRMRELGKVALRGELGEVAKESARRDWLTSLAEMLENSPEFKSQFEISDVYTYPIADGQIMFITTEGQLPMEQMIRDGESKALAVAKADPRMSTQANRDSSDVHNIVRLNEMASDSTAPNTRLGISRSLGRAFDKDPEFWSEKGYRKDLAFIQAYYMDRERGGVWAGTLSVDGVSDEVFDKVLAEYGVYMQSGDNDNGMRHGIERSFGSEDEAMAWARAVRARCYELQGDTRRRWSVNEFMKARKQYLSAAFDSLCVPIAQSIAAGVKNGDVHTFVMGLLQDTGHLDRKLTADLYKLALKKDFDDDDGRLLLGLSLYAAAEKLHLDVKMLLSNRQDPNFAPVSYAAETAPQQFLHQLAGFVHNGAEAGRSHGGSCPGRLNVSGGPDDGSLDNPQAAFGGLSKDGQGSNEEADGGSWSWKKGICRVESCSTRPATTMVGPCSVCRGCQRKFDQGLDPTKISAPRVEKYDAVADLREMMRGKKSDYELIA